MSSSETINPKHQSNPNGASTRRHVECGLVGHARRRFMSAPTPLHPLPGLGVALNIDLWVKRDDLTELGGGGNKVRKLEFLMAQAIEDGADTILTPGSPQSNHCRLTAAAAACCGLRCELFTTAPSAGLPAVYHETGNRFLFDVLGATVHALDPQADTGPSLEQRADELQKLGQRPFIIPVGGSTAIGSLGYVAAASEMAELGFDVTVVATGSGGMLAGLIVGNTLEQFSNRMIGVSVGRDEQRQHDLVTSLVKACASIVPSVGVPGPCDIFDGARGPGYGLVDDDTIAAVHQAAQLDGLLLDPVYTGKAMAGLIKLRKSGTIKPRERVLFWHSGGAPALFAYPDALAKEDDHA